MCLNNVNFIIIKLKYPYENIYSNPSSIVILYVSYIKRIRRASATYKQKKWKLQCGSGR